MRRESAKKEQIKPPRPGTENLQPYSKAEVQNKP